MKKTFIKNSNFFTSKLYAIGLASIGLFANGCSQGIQNSFMKTPEKTNPTELGFKKEELKSSTESTKVKHEDEIDTAEISKIETLEKESNQIFEENFLEKSYARIEEIDDTMEELRLEKSTLKESIDQYMKYLKNEIKTLKAELKKVEHGTKDDERSKRLKDLEIELAQAKIFIDSGKLAKKTAKLESLKGDLK